MMKNHGSRKPASRGFLFFCQTKYGFGLNKSTIKSIKTPIPNRLHMSRYQAIVQVFGISIPKTLQTIAARSKASTKMAISFTLTLKNIPSAPIKSINNCCALLTITLETTIDIMNITHINKSFTPSAFHHDIMGVLSHPHNITSRICLLRYSIQT